MMETASPCAGQTRQWRRRHGLRLWRRDASWTPQTPSSRGPLPPQSLSHPLRNPSHQRPAQEGRHPPRYTAPIPTLAEYRTGCTESRICCRVLHVGGLLGTGGTCLITPLRSLPRQNTCTVQAVQNLSHQLPNASRRRLAWDRRRPSRYPVPILTSAEYQYRTGCTEPLASAAECFTSEACLGPETPVSLHRSDPYLGRIPEQYRLYRTSRICCESFTSEACSGGGAPVSYTASIVTSAEYLHRTGCTDPAVKTPAVQNATCVPILHRTSIRASELD
jgi:hypothetical protein